MTKKNARLVRPRFLGWKTNESDPNLRRKILLGIGTLLGLVALILLGKFIGFLINLNQPITKTNYNSSIDYFWDGESTVNLIVKSDKLNLVSLDPTSGIATILQIPDETYLGVPFGYGSWPVRSIYDLGQSESDKIGSLLLTRSLSKSLGLPIDGYLILKNELEAQNIDQVMESVRSNLLTTFKIISNSESDLSSLELFKLGFSIRGVRFDKITIFDLERSKLTEWKVLADKSRVLALNSLELDRFIQANFPDPNIVEEGLNIAVYNATDHPGLAADAARLLTNIGARVIVTQSSEQKLTQTKVMGSDSYTYKRIAQVFAPDCLVEKKLFLITTGGCDKIGSDAVHLERADINLILGEDFYNWFIKKSE